MIESFLSVPGHRVEVLVVDDGSTDDSADVVRAFAGDEVRLTVSDHGPGIPRPRRAHIFEPGMTSCERGQGLGLSSARRLAQDQGGDMRLVSGENGCCFMLMLPAEPSVSSIRPVRAQAG